jgi:hypothetical protein
MVTATNFIFVGKEVGIINKVVTKPYISRTVGCIDNIVFLERIVRLVKVENTRSFVVRCVF